MSLPNDPATGSPIQFAAGLFRGQPSAAAFVGEDTVPFVLTHDTLLQGIAALSDLLRADPLAPLPPEPASPTPAEGVRLRAKWCAGHTDPAVEVTDATGSVRRTFTATGSCWVAVAYEVGGLIRQGTGTR